MSRLFTTDTLTYKRNKQKSVYQETYDDCSFAFEFVPMNTTEKFCKQAFLEEYVQVDGFEKVDAVGYLDVSYSKIDKFNRLFYFISDDADPSIHDIPSLENVRYGILGSNGVNPFNNVKDELFPFSNSMIKAGYANNASTYADNTKLRHDYIRYTAKTITGGYALSDIFSNENELILGVGELDASFNMDFSKKINDLSGCVYEGPDTEGWKTCRSLVTGLLDFSNEMDTTTTRFKRGTKFLSDLAEQSINTFESEKNMSQGEFWVKFHPGDAIAVRLTYTPENGDKQPARNSLGFLGENKLENRSYKIYLRFNKATLDEALYDILIELSNVLKYESDADKAIGQKTVHMPDLLSDSLDTISLAKDAIEKSFDNEYELRSQFNNAAFNNTSYVHYNVSAQKASGEVNLVDSKLKIALESITEIKSEIINASVSLNNVSNFTGENNYQNVYSKIEAVPDVMTNIAKSLINIADINNAKDNMSNVSVNMSKSFDVMEISRKYAELNVSAIIPSVESYAKNMSGMISLLNASSSARLANASSNMSADRTVVVNEKKNAYKEFISASVAQDATLCRLHARKANESSTITEKLNDEIIQEYNSTVLEVENVSNMSYKLNKLSNFLSELNTSVNNTSGFSDVNKNTSTIIKNVLDTSDNSRSKLVPSVELTGFLERGMEHKLDSKLKNMQSAYHAENAKKIADMWVTNEEVAKSEAVKVLAMTAARTAVVTDATYFYSTAVATRIAADAFLANSSVNLSNASTIWTNASTDYFNASNTLDQKNTSWINASTNLVNANASYQDALNNANASSGVFDSALQDKLRKEKDAAEKLQDYNVKKSKWDVLLSTATTLGVIANSPNGTQYEKETHAAAVAEAEEADSIQNTAKENYYGNAIIKGAKRLKEEAEIFWEMTRGENETAKRNLTEKFLDRDKKKEEFDKATIELTDATTAKSLAKEKFDKAVDDLRDAHNKFNDADKDQNDKQVKEGLALDAIAKANRELKKADDIDEINADCRAFIAASKDRSVVGEVDYAIAVAADDCKIERLPTEVDSPLTSIMNIPVVSANTAVVFDCKLSDKFKQLTNGLGGTFTLYDITNGIPIHQNATALVNDSVVTFTFTPTTSGAKLLQVIYEYQDKKLLGKAFTLYVNPAASAGSESTGEVVTLKCSRPYNQSFYTNNYPNNATSLLLDGVNNESGATIQQIGNKVRFTFTQLGSADTLNNIRDNIVLQITELFKNQTSGAYINGTKVSNGVYDLSGVVEFLSEDTFISLDAGSLASWKENLDNTKYIVNP